MKTIITISVIVWMMLMTNQVYAGRYSSCGGCPRVDYSCGCRYTNCCKKVYYRQVYTYRPVCSRQVIEIVSHAPYRHSSRGSEQMEEYAWISAP